MLSKLKISLKRVNYKLFFALLVLGLAPTVYTTVRVFFLGQLPGEWSFSIAGQLSWVNLIYEILNEAIILPLFYFVGKVNTEPLITHTYPLSQIDEAYEVFENKRDGVIKVAVEC